MLSIRLNPKIEQRFTALAARTGRTKSYYVREALLEHLEEMEDRYLAIERLKNPSKRWSLDDVEQDLDLAGRARRPCSEGAAHARPGWVRAVDSSQGVAERFEAPSEIGGGAVALAGEAYRSDCWRPGLIEAGEQRVCRAHARGSRCRFLARSEVCV